MDYDCSQKYCSYLTILQKTLINNVVTWPFSNCQDSQGAHRLNELAYAGFWLEIQMYELQRENSHSQDFLGGLLVSLEFTSSAWSRDSLKKIPAYSCNMVVVPTLRS